MKHKRLTVMLDFFADNFSNCVWLAVFIVALIPTLESKIAIPFGMSAQIFGSGALSPASACIIGVLAGVLPAAALIFFVRKIKDKSALVLSDKFLNFANLKLKKHLDKFTGKATVLKKCVYLSGFVAIPMPLTGVYTGSLIAGLSSLKFWQGFLAISVGEIFACVGMTLICTLFENSAFCIFVMAMIFVAVMLLANLAIFLFGRKKKGEIKKEKRS